MENNANTALQASNLNTGSQKNHALVVDDEPDIRDLLSITLKQLGLEVTEAASVTQALQALTQQTFSFCLTDMRLPDGNGLELVEHIQNSLPDMPVAVITAFGSTDTAVEALKKGAFDFVSKPVELPRLRAMVQKAMELFTERTPLTTEQTGLTGNSQVMADLRHQIARVARSQAPIFISGESGSGKELVARAIHYHGPRANGPFIPVNCGAIPSELMESEFFGHKKGSFTGAFQDKQGLFQAADGGTLFLDEVADLPLSMQVKLLRVIQEKTLRPVGTHEEKSVDVRILSATHKNLAREVASGLFRQDLFYRINVIEINTPRLRDHAEDIPELAQLFLLRFAKSADTTPPTLDQSAKDLLLHYGFPGNVRELENMLERAFTLCENGIISAADLQLQEHPAPAVQTGTAMETVAPPPNMSTGDVPVFRPDHSIDDYLASVEKEIIEKALEECRWNKTATAKKLGISFRQMRYKLKKLGVD